jgi:DNA polymerase-1
MVHFIKTTGKEFDEALTFLKTLKVINVDTETTGIDAIRDKILLIQMGNMYQQYVFDVARLHDSIQLLRPFFESQSITKIMHNAKFDYKFLKRDLGIETENIFDTMLAEQLLQKGRKMSGFGLDVVSEKYTGVLLNKTVRQTFQNMSYGDAISTPQVEYAAGDIKHLAAIMDAQQKLIIRDNLQQVINTEMGVIMATGDMELNGMKIDRTKWLAAEAVAKRERTVALDKLDKMLIPYIENDIFGRPIINYNSPKQLLNVLQTAVDKNITTTREGELKEISHPIIDALLYYRGMEKRVTTYGEAFLKNIHELTGLIHTEFNQAETDTGRYSSKNPKILGV